MSRHPQDPRVYYGDRYLPEPRMPAIRPFSTDPASYISSAGNIDGWRAHRTNELVLPHKDRDRPQIPPFRAVKSIVEGQHQLKLKKIDNFHPSQGSRRPETSPGDRDTERSVQNTPHFRRPEERASERHAPTAHDSRKTRRSEWRDSENSGTRGKSLARNKDFKDLSAGSRFHTGMSHAFPARTFNIIEQRPRKSGDFSERETNDIIEYIKARKNWRQISQKLGRSLGSVRAHWYIYLKKDPRAEGVTYDPEYNPEMDLRAGYFGRDV